MMDLPNEIWLEIVSYLNLTGVVNLHQLSKRFAFMEKYKYHGVTKKCYIITAGGAIEWMGEVKGNIYKIYGLSRAFIINFDYALVQENNSIFWLSTNQYNMNKEAITKLFVSDKIHIVCSPFAAYGCIDMPLCPEMRDDYFLTNNIDTDSINWDASIQYQVLQYKIGRSHIVLNTGKILCYPETEPIRNLMPKFYEILVRNE
jgi:hypothetical protein